MVLPYYGYGCHKKLYVKGQVLENRPEFLSDSDDKTRKNFKTMIARYFSSPIPECSVEIRINNKKYQAKSNDLGFFSLWIDLPEALQNGWHQAEYIIYNDQSEVTCKEHGDFLIENGDAGFGVISDIDDTILISHSTQLLRKLRLILTKNSKTRLPFEGVSGFYSKLKAKGHPFFYVSSSEWNLYDFLVDFFEVRELPKGPFLLQEFKSGFKELLFSGGGDHEHKLLKIRRLMKLFPTLQFILIGDSGQRDPDIYHQVLTEFPGRIKAVYIRIIGKSNSQEKKAVFESQNVPMLYVEDTMEAEAHALQMGYI